jgi:tRNA pseudouridine65 synthase
VGDTTYGKSPHNRLFRERLGSDRLLLAAVEIGFEHPATGERIHIVAPLDPEFSALVRTLGWEKHVSQNWLCGT